MGVVCAALVALLGSALAQERIVSLHQKTTDVLFDLGLAEAVVGRSFHSSPFVDPASGVSAEDLPDIGFEFNVSAEAVLALSPTLIVGTEDNGPPQAIAQLRGAGVPVLLVSAQSDLEGSAARIREIAAALGVSGRGEALLERLEAQRQALEARLAATPERVGGLVMVGWSGAPQACGGDSDFHAMYVLAGGHNLLEALNGCPEINPEALPELPVDVLFFPALSQYEAVGGVAGLRARPGFAQLRAVQTGRAVIMESPAFRGMGASAPRFAQAIHEALYEHGGVVLVTPEGAVTPYAEAP
ncbi:heme/hemin ABC transporter substrate-binding protein [Truepera radiovictrix]|uniref:Periplasmic binding protein n=1 Tax=Truepera radiovictrix (strain DSM 17093 / CIP 108686 / LMG 22925 / RQ-24) TaxID=649638 RepID=D7CXC9_TRURR|nr:ABC transporter substrate-binding protein [Truepera radiovictrix]ADI13253.1 periplasmic binding protein [Truepera radiovictrix DSM 17093]WMT58183.1 ABC transporter substrate-binding protein [Truepera radiovictrix]